MDSFEINKLLGALLGTCLVLLAVHIASGAIFAKQRPAKPGYIIEVKQEAPQPAGGQAKPAPQVPFDTLLASASVERGSQVAKQCEICHNLGKGQGNKIGPDLYGVVGRKVASEPGFNYTSALKDSEVAKSGDGTWTFDKLDKWITDPRADVPGTAMTFAGISNEKQRADLVAYLNSNSDKPLPLPKAAQANPTPQKPAAGSAPATTPAGNPPAGQAPAQPGAGAAPASK